MRIGTLAGRLREIILQAADRYLNGQRRLLRRIRDWTTDQPAHRWQTTLTRHLGALLGLAAAGAGGRPGIGALVVTWIVASVLHYQPPPSAGEIERRDDLQYLLALMGPHRGIHLDALDEALRSSDNDQWIYADTVRWLDHLGVPRRRSVRVLDGVRTGIHRDDVEALLRGEQPLPQSSGTKRKPSTGAVEQPVDPDVERLREMGRGRG